MVSGVNIKKRSNEKACEITHAVEENIKKATVKKRTGTRVIFYYAPKQCQNFTL
ncbi:hypothetical protein BN137_2233 [Cronobacter condimenti 1330]|uniref:Uncharacterized protein n=1 Tax=Cronobacter condimenti 1330 TaxID=1073999 RepID=K8AAS5_9ENTR|nr:hypothetical protein BN137_2233 [Cronobacter condimenti 1330]